MVRFSDMTGNQSPTSISRTVDKVFDDSQYTGEINLGGRKLKHYPQSASKYDLIDTTHVDLSRNRFGDVPAQVCYYHSLEHLNCYHNVIKSIPSALMQLQNLVHLNLSRNQLSVLPRSLYQLDQLQVLLINNNRLVSLPEEIGRLQHLMELDVACNEITHLPTQMGDLDSLRCLNLRRNLLVELPISLCRLRLCRLNFSCNRIAHIPCDFHKMDSLEELCIDNNPLLSPPAHACTKGLVHVMKLLCLEALRDERRRGVVQNDINLRGNMTNATKRFASHSTLNSDETSNQSENGDFDRSRLSMVDSGYSTTDSGRKVFVQNSEDFQRQKVDYDLRKKRAEQLKSETTEGGGRTGVNFPSPGETQRTERNPRENGNLADHNVGLQTQSFRETRPSGSTVIPVRRVVSDADTQPISRSTSEFWSTNVDESYHSSSSSSTPLDPNLSPHWYSDRSGSIPIPVQHVSSSNLSSNDGSPQPKDDELRRRHEAVVAQHRREALNVHQRFEDERNRMRQAYDGSGFSTNSNSFVRSNDDGNSGGASRTYNETVSSSSKPGLPLACQRALDAMSADLNTLNPVFTIRRNLQHAQEEQEQIDHLRRIIESLLKVKLPEDLPGALRDGVVLCHLANHVQPRSVATIHVPSPAVPNLSHAKCIRNVENFLHACRRLGIDQDNICSSAAILEERGIVEVSMTVQALVGCPSLSQQSVV